MTMPQIRVGVIGTGFGARVHVPAFQAVEQCAVAGIASRDPAHARVTAERLRLPRAFDTWQELVAAPEVDVVSIATPPSLHAEIVTAAIHAKKAVLCEKPFTMGSVEAQHLLASARNASIVHGVNFLFRGVPAFREVKQAIASGALGMLRSVEISWSVGSWADPARPWQWQCMEEAGGGILSALVVHTLDTLEWICGPIAQLSAHLRTCIPERPGPDGRLLRVTAPDDCQLLLLLESGTPVTCSVTNVAPRGMGHRLVIHGEQKTMVAMSENIQDYGKGFRLFEGSMGIPLLTERTLSSLPDEGSPALTPSERFGWTGEASVGKQDGRIALMIPLIRRFIAALRGEAPMEPSFREGVRTQVLLEAIRTAEKTRRWVQCPPPLL